ncbi:hypothetical protein [Streptomyces violascens]|uniref:hypothetical protein n=1 Tax=Streptomyces violascens TaxID=67381 RepID=UPI0016727D80|nr:hypothetical protein [Streptomyces violascens]GGU47644.1 hypothetical protein GCM10010289_80270 [Streptomyces violascens]
MKISVSLTGDLPIPAQWAFGHSLETSGGTAAVVREDVRAMILNAVQAGIPLLEEADAEVALKP